LIMTQIKQKQKQNIKILIRIRSQNHPSKLLEIYITTIGRRRII